MALLKEMEKDFARVTSLGSAEWGLAAIYKTAAAYRAMATEVSHAPVPAELAGTDRSVPGGDRKADGEAV